MKILTTREFNGAKLDCYEADNQDDGFWVTREQIGRLLGYSDPTDAIKKIHKRNSERLDKYSRGGQIVPSSGGMQTVTLYNFKGFLEICRFSNKPKANDVIDFAWNVMDEIRRTGSYGTPKVVVLKEVDKSKGISGLFSSLGWHNRPWEE